MKVLITGVAGQLGSCFARWLQENVGCEIVGIDNRSCGYEENIPSGVLTYDITLGSGRTQPNDLDTFFQGVDYVFHFAAYAAEGLSPFIREFDTRNNLLSTLEVINTSIRTYVKRVVFASSMAVYGVNAPPFDESYSRRPVDPYGISKTACELHFESAKAIHGLDYCILRPHNIFGPYQSGWQVFRNVIANWACRSLEGLPMIVYGSGNQLRAFSYIDDILPCLWNAAVRTDCSGQIINIGGSTPRTIRDVADQCAYMFGSEIVHGPERKEVHSAWCTTQKSHELLNYRETTPFGDGVGMFWDWFREAWEQYPERRGTQKVAPIEVIEGIYPYWKSYV